MQCPSCSFENMPGMEGCARCGAHMKNDAVESFMPPRATVAQKIVRRIRRTAGGMLARGKPDKAPATRAVEFRGKQTPSWFSERFSALRLFINPDLTIPWWKDSRVIAGLLNFIPGLGYLYLGRLVRGLVFLVLSVGAFLLASRFYLTTTGAWCRWLFAFLLATSVYDSWFVREGSEFTWKNIVLPTAMMFAAVWLVSYPVESVSRAWGLKYVTVAEDRGPIKAGDATLFKDDFAQNGDPQLGDIVYARGPKVDIVLGCPGDLVEWKEGVAWINGEKREDLVPFARRGKLMDFTVRVPANTWLIMPEVWLGGEVSPLQWEQFVRDYGFSWRHDILYRYRDRTAEVLADEH